MSKEKIVIDLVTSESSDESADESSQLSQSDLSLEDDDDDDSDYVPNLASKKRGKNEVATKKLTSELIYSNFRSIE